MVIYNSNIKYNNTEKNEANKMNRQDERKEEAIKETEHF